MATEFQTIFARLRTILKNHIGSLTVKEDTPTCYCLEGGLHPKQKTPMPIAWVQIGKAYVSYHLMPIYGCPKLLDGFSSRLKARMQGKSCFNFKVADEDLFRELDQLTLQSFTAFKKAGFLSPPPKSKR
jgi:hypothetical protein